MSTGWETVEVRQRGRLRQKFEFKKYAGVPGKLNKELQEDNNCRSRKAQICSTLPLQQPETNQM